MGGNGKGLIVDGALCRIDFGFKKKEMLMKKLKYLLLVLAVMTGSSVFAKKSDNPYVYSFDEVMKRQRDIIVSPYIGIGMFPTDLIPGVNLLVYDPVFLPKVFIDASVEVPNGNSFAFNAKAGLALTKYSLASTYLKLRSYSGGYRTTVVEVIEVNIPHRRGSHFYGVVIREQMPYAVVSDPVFGSSLATMDGDNGTIFFGGGLGGFSSYDYKAQVVQGEKFHKKYNTSVHSMVNLNILYAPTGLYRGLAASLDGAYHGRFMTYRYEFLYSFASNPDIKATQMTITGRMRFKLSVGFHFGATTRKPKNFDMKCISEAETIEDCPVK